MRSFIKKIAIITMLIGVVNVTFADRGAGKKSKSKTILNINTATSFKNSILSNLRSGLVYKGTLLTSKATGNSIINSTLMTYQKGNVTYIIPYKTKIAVPEMKQGYAGLKLIIRSKR
jgi:hypothetical protein